MAALTSTSNPRVRELSRLARARVRREVGRHLVEGPNAVREALAAGVVDELFFTDTSALDTVLPGAPRPEVVTTKVSAQVLERLSDAVTPQGVVAVARTRTVNLDQLVGRGLLLVLHEVADPGNAGTIVRTADAAGARGVILTEGSVDVFAPKVVRAAAGSTYHLPIVVGVTLAQVAAAVRETGQRMVGLDAAGAGGLDDLERDASPLALVAGNEAHGLSDRDREHLDEVVAVPIYGRAESLNVAAAAAVALYAAARGFAQER